jgi:ParB-like chromosome segregation protein Spo0J
MATPARDPNDVQLEWVPLSQLQGWPRNPKDHDLGAIASSLGTYGYVTPVVVNRRNSMLLAGHGRVDALLQRKAEGLPPPPRIQLGAEGEWLVPTVFVDLPEAQHEPYLVMDNRSTELGGWTEPLLLQVLKTAHEADMLEATGYDEEDLEDLSRRIAGLPSGSRQEIAKGKLAETFGVPPFSVLDARQGYWRDRKRAWVEVGSPPTEAL